MGKAILGLLSLSTALLVNSAWADEFPVTGSGATGHPGDRVFVDLTYDYGASFNAIAEDLNIQYPGVVLKMAPDASTIDMGGATRNLHAYADMLEVFAQAHFGSVLENTDPVLPGGLEGYAMSFYTADGTGQARSGLVHLRVAFDIPVSTAPARYKVSFVNSVLADEGGAEFAYPDALQSLSVTVLSAVPEPATAWLLLSGCGLLGLDARRRSAARS